MNHRERLKLRDQMESAADADEISLPTRSSAKERRLALAYYIERMIDEGVIKSYADAARRLGITRARLTQVMDLSLLPVADQEGILAEASRPTKSEIAKVADARGRTS